MHLYSTNTYSNLTILLFHLSTAYHPPISSYDLSERESERNKMQVIIFGIAHGTAYRYAVCGLHASTFCTAYMCFPRPYLVICSSSHGVGSGGRSVGYVGEDRNRIPVHAHGATNEKDEYKKSATENSDKTS